MGVVSMRNQCESVMETGTNLSLVAFKQGVAMASFQPIVPKLKHKLFFFFPIVLETARNLDMIRMSNITGSYHWQDFLSVVFVGQHHVCKVQLLSIFCLGITYF